MQHRDLGPKPSSVALVGRERAVRGPGGWDPQRKVSESSCVGGAPEVGGGLPLSPRLDLDMQVLRIRPPKTFTEWT